MYTRNMPPMAPETKTSGKGTDIGKMLLTALGAMVLAAVIAVAAVLFATFATRIMLPKLDHVGMATLSEQAAMAQFSEEASRK